MKATKKKRPVFGWVCLCVGILSGGVPAQAHELRLELTGASDVGGALEQATDGLWQGFRLRYALPAAGPVHLHLGTETASADAISGASLSPLELRRNSFFLGAGVSFPLFWRLDLELAGLASADWMKETFSPAGGSQDVITRREGFSAGGSIGVFLALSRHWSIPLTVHAQRFSLDGPLEAITSTQIGLRTGISFRLGSKD